MMQMKQPLRYGIVAGVLVVLYFFILYLLRPTLMLAPWAQWTSLVLYVVFMWYALRQQSPTTHEPTFQQRLQQAFLVFIIANIIYYIFYYVLYNYIEPNMSELHRQRDLIALKAMHTRHLLNDEDYAQMEQSIRTSDYAVALRTVLFGVARGAIGGFLLAFLLTFVVKKLEEN